MSHINPSARGIFKRIAQQQWHQLGKRHKLKLDRSEVAVTDDIIYKLVRFIKQNPGAGIEVWKSRNEDVNGHDIDLFIRDYSSTGFYWFPLQAKVLDQQQQYAHIAPGGKKSQWPLLKRLQVHAATNGVFCQPYYVWYTGFTPHTITTYLSRWQKRFHRDLAANPSLKMADQLPVWRAAFGCSLTAVKIVQKVCEVHARPWYHHFHNQSAVRKQQTIPWHHVFNYQFAKQLPKASSGRAFLDSEVQNRKRFYDHTIAPFAPKKGDPVSYYYYRDLASSEEPELMGRYMVIVDRTRLENEWLSAVPSQE